MNKNVKIQKHIVNCINKNIIFKLSRNYLKNASINNHLKFAKHITYVFTSTRILAIQLKFKNNMFKNDTVVLSQKLN